MYESEFGYAYEDFYPVPSGETIKLTVPRITGTVQDVGINMGVSGGCYENKPPYNKIITGIDYINATMKENCDWLDKLNNKGIIEKGYQFVVDFENANPTEPYATTK